MAQDDAHIFCEPDQVEAEVNRFFELMNEVYRALGFSGVRIAVSTRPGEFLGEPADWDKAEQTLVEAVRRAGYECGIKAGEGAFYGPKIEVDVDDVLGRAWTLATLQMDVAMPPRFALRYVGRDGGEHQPAMLHRAVLGSLERFLALYIEHTGGDFPLWLAPVQVVVADRHRARRRSTAGACATRSPRPACARSSTTATRSSASRCARPSSRRCPSSPWSATRKCRTRPSRRAGVATRVAAATPLGARRLRGRAPRGDRRTARLTASQEDGAIAERRPDGKERGDSTRINERIRAREIRLIGADGAQLGVMTPEAAMVLAEEAGLDLVEVASAANPPVCRIMDYGKYKYEEKKKKAAGKTKGSAELKEVKLRPGTDEHDLNFKMKQARRFLMEGDKVKVTVMFRGREMVHREHGYRQLDKVREIMGTLATTESMPRMEGRFLSMILVGNRDEITKQKRIDAEAAKAEAEAEALAQAQPESAPGGLGRRMTCRR